MVSPKTTGAGFRHTQVLALDQTTGLPLASVAGATAYEGLQAELAKALTINVPDPQIIQHTGDDRVGQTDLLPPTEALSAELRTGKSNLTLDALLSNVNVFSIGDMQAMLLGTDQQGLEPLVCILAYRQALDPSGARCWNWAMMPKARAFPKPASMEEGGVDENTYTIQPTVVTKWPWGLAFESATEGAVETQMARGVSRGRPKMEAWLIDATPTLVLTLGGTARMNEAGTDYAIKVYLYAAATKTASDITATSTLAADQITVVGAVENDIVVAFYEQAD
jgi:hypothetical protein